MSRDVIGTWPSHDEREPQRPKERRNDDRKGIAAWAPVIFAWVVARIVNAASSTSPYAQAHPALWPGEARHRLAPEDGIYISG